MNLTWTSNQTHVTEQQLFDEATYTFQELVKYFMIRRAKLDKENKNAVRLNLSAELPSTIKEHRHRKFGKCFTYIADEDKDDCGVYYIQIKL